MVGSLDARLVYRNAKIALKDAGVPLAKAILSQSFLRFEVALTNQNTNYEYNVLVNQSNQGQPAYPTEQRLNLQDSFFVSHMGVFLVVASTSLSNTIYKNMLMTFPSAIFDGMWSPPGMYNFYNGFLSLTVNNRVLCPAWDLLKHLNVPETQYPTWAGPLPASTFYPQLDELDGSQNGFYPVEPNWVLIGSKNNQLSLQLPESFGVSLNAAPASVRAVVVCRGVLAQNSTSVH